MIQVRSTRRAKKCLLVPPAGLLVPPARLLVGLAVLLPALTRPAPADSFVVADNMKVLRANMPDTTYRFAGSNAPGQVFFPGEPVNLKLVLTKGTDSGAVQDFGLEIQEVTTRDPATPLFALEGRPIQFPLQVTFGDQPELTLEVANVPVPQRFGTYAVILQRGQKRQFLATLARVPHPVAGGTIETTPIFGEGQMLDNPALMAAYARQYERMGVHGWRSGLTWNETLDGRTDWTACDALFNAAKAAHCQVLAALDGCPPQWRKFGDVAPAVGWTPDNGGYGGTADWAVAPENYARYGRWIEALTRRYYDGARGGLWGLANYNEPWEGGSNSGWARDMLQYRALQVMMAQSAKRVDPRVQICAASSIMNTEDKLFSDGTHAMDADIDVFTDTLVPPAMCYGPMVARAHGKASIEQEPWFATTEFQLPQVMTQFLGSGQRSIPPCRPDALFDSLPGTQDNFFIPSPVVAATAAFNKFVTGKRFNRMVFPNHLPFLFQFGDDSDRDALLVMCGQLMPMGGDDPKEQIWAQVNAAPGGSITIDNHDGLLQFFDLAGNPLYARQKTVQLPLSVAATYLKCRRGPAAAAARLKLAVIEGKRPVEIIPHDFNAPLDNVNTLEVVVHNCLNRAITGTLTAKAPDYLVWHGPARQAISLQAGESKTVSFAVGRNPAAAVVNVNSYHFEFAFASDAGTADYGENLNEAIARKGTKTIDGNLDDWTDVPGVTVIGTTENVDTADLLIRNPWPALAQAHPQATVGELKLAWDDDNLYVAARVNDPTPEANAIRLATRDENAYFHSAADDTVPPYQTFINALRQKTGDPKRSFAEVPYVYRKSPEAGIPFRRDRIQFALDVKPGWHDMKQVTRVPEGFHAVPDTDYEYSLYWVNDGQDGAGELWRQLAPRVPRMHDWPRQPRGVRTTGPVPGARQVVRRDGSTYIYEASIPRRELAGLQFKAGTSFGFTFKVGNSEGRNAEYGHDKAATKLNGLTLHPYWERSPDCGTRWTLTN